MKKCLSNRKWMFFLLLALLAYTVLIYLLRNSLKGDIAGILIPRIDDNLDYDVVLLWTHVFGVEKWHMPISYRAFEACPERRCRFSYQQEDFSRAKAVMFHMRDLRHISDIPSQPRPKRQVWGILQMESAEYALSKDAPLKLRDLDDFFQLTATYRVDSDFWTPYGTFTARKTNLKTELSLAGRDRFAVAFTSNCYTASRREVYIRQLAKHMPIDIFGSCGTSKQNPCPKGPQNKECLSSLLQHYKFYLAFENSRCLDYITEKFWNNALSFVPIIPVVMGPTATNYARLAPPHSFIHIDDYASPKELARYLREVSANESLYHSYIDWWRHFEVTSPHYNQSWVCQICALIHNETRLEEVSQHSYQLSSWFSRETNCLG